MYIHTASAHRGRINEVLGKYFPRRESCSVESRPLRCRGGWDCGDSPAEDGAPPRSPALSLQRWAMLQGSPNSQVALTHFPKENKCWGRIPPLVEVKSIWKRTTALAGKQAGKL